MHVSLIQDRFLPKRCVIHSTIKQNIVVSKFLLIVRKVQVYPESIMLIFILDCLQGEKFFAGEVILHSIQSHLGKHGDGGNILGKLDLPLMKVLGGN